MNWTETERDEGKKEAKTATTKKWPIQANFIYLMFVKLFAANLPVTFVHSLHCRKTTNNWFTCYVCFHWLYPCAAAYTQNGRKNIRKFDFVLFLCPALSTVAKIHFRMFCKMSNVQSCWQELCVVEAEMNAVLHIMSLRGIIPAMRTEQIWHEAEIHNIGIKTIFIDEWLACDRMGHVRFHSPASMCKHTHIHI